VEPNLVIIKGQKASKTSKSQQLGILQERLMRILLRTMLEKSTSKTTLNSQKAWQVK
jgi:hypothetical protein